MVDMQDPEVIESLKYLFVPKEEKMRTQARPFDGKKNCWIPHRTMEGFLCYTPNKSCPICTYSKTTRIYFRSIE